MSSSKLKTGEGDWICGDPKCGNVNFARRMKCNKCGLSKNDPKLKAAVIKKTGVEIGKEAAERSRGLFSADDWSCKTCGNINWAKRGNCNLCHAPRYSKEEARTGLGGGYFERDGVEYVNRADSDDEYDEFGRKKKKYRVSSSRGTNYDRDQRSGRNSGRRSDSDDDHDRRTGRRQERRSDRETRRRSRSPTHRRRDEDDEEEEDEDVSKYQLDDDDDDDADSAKYRLDADSDDGKGASSKSKHSQSGNHAEHSNRGAERDSHANKYNQRERRERHRDHSKSDSDGEAHHAKRKRRNSSSSSR